MPLWPSLRSFSLSTSAEKRAAKLRHCLGLPPYKPAAFSWTYSRILARMSGGSVGAASMRLIIDAERPVALWQPLRIVQTVLRGSPQDRGLFVQRKDRMVAVSVVYRAECTF